MKHILSRLVEAAKHYHPPADYLSLIGVDGDLMVNRYGNPNLGWMLAFVTLTDDETTIAVNTVKYVSRMGTVTKVHVDTGHGIYGVMESIRVRLVHDNTISAKVGSELTRFADFVIMTNDETETDYELTDSDLSRYQTRIHRCNNETA